MWVLARLVIHAFFFRYALITVVGAAVLFGRGVALAGRRAQRLALVAILALLPVPLLRQRGVWNRNAASQEAYAAYAARLANRASAPVVFDDEELDFLAIYHRADARDASRFFALSDVDGELRLSGFDTLARAFEGLQRYRDVHVRKYGRFVAAHHVLLVSRPFHEGAYTLPRLLEDPKAHLELLSVQGDLSAFLVTFPGVKNTVVQR